MADRTIMLNGGARPASELAELARRALDTHLGFALKDQLDGPDPDAIEAARVFGDFFALAARQGETVTLNDEEQARLIIAGRSDQHIRKLDLLVRHNMCAQPLSDGHLKLQLDAIGMTFRPAQAENDRRIMLEAWAEAQHRAALFHTTSVQAHTNPIQHLADCGLTELTARSPDASPARAAATSPESDDEDSSALAPGMAMPLLSTIIPQVVAGIVAAGRWKDGPGSVAEDAQRLLDQFCWMIGDFPANEYTQRHLAEFDREMMAMPKTIKAKTVWAKPYVDAKKSFPALTPANKRNSRTINKDLSYLSTFTDRMVSEGYWMKGAIQPLLLSHAVTKKQKEKAKAPWTIDHVRQMLGCPIYQGNAGPKRRLRPGNFIYQDAAYWLLLLTIYTAGCQSELGGLLLDEIDDNSTTVPHIVIQDNCLRTLKRDARERVVPIHPRLLALGFLDYVEQLRRAGATELFPELWMNAVKRGGDQYRAVVWDKLIAWLRAQGVQIPLGIGGKAADFHSLRSTVLSLLDRADINQNIVKDIAGHAREGVTAGTYQDLVASGGLDEALRERLIVLERLPDFTAGISRCAPKLLPIKLRSR